MSERIDPVAKEADAHKRPQAEPKRPKQESSVLIRSEWVALPEDDGAITVDEHPVFEVPADGSGEDATLDLSSRAD